MISSKLSNFYTPGESKEICIKEQTIEINWDSSSEDEKESDLSILRFRMVLLMDQRITHLTKSWLNLSKFPVWLIRKLKEL